MATAVIDLSALETNLSAIRSLLTESTQVLGAVKANAYGHGAIHVTRALESAGVRWFAVATPGELLELRRSEEHTSELQSRGHLVCRLLLENKQISRDRLDDGSS